MAYGEPNWETISKDSIDTLAPALKELRLRGSWLIHPKSSGLQPDIVGDVDYFVSFEDKDVYLYLIMTCKGKPYYERITLGSIWEHNGGYRFWCTRTTEDIVTQALDIKRKFERERVPELTSPVRFLFTPWAFFVLLFVLQMFLSMNY